MYAAAQILAKTRAHAEMTGLGTRLTLCSCSPSYNLRTSASSTATSWVSCTVHGSVHTLRQPPARYARRSERRGYSPPCVSGQSLVAPRRCWPFRPPRAPASIPRSACLRAGSDTGASQRERFRRNGQISASEKQLCLSRESWILERAEGHRADLVHHVVFRHRQVFEGL